MTNSSGQFSFTNVPTFGLPNSFVVVTDSNSLPIPAGPLPSDATATGPLTPGGLLTGLEIPLIPATNSTANSLQGMFSTMSSSSPPGAGDDVTFVPAQPVSAGILIPGFIGNELAVDVLVPPLATPNGSTNGTLNGSGGAPFLTTTALGADCSDVTCPALTNCACFSMAAPNGNPVTGAPSTTGTGYTQPTPPEGCAANPAACYATYFWAATVDSLTPTLTYGVPDCPDENSFCTGSGEPLGCCTGVGTGTCYLPLEQPNTQSPFQLDELSSVTSVPAGNLPSAFGAFVGCQ